MGGQRVRCWRASSVRATLVVTSPQVMLVSALLLLLPYLDGAELVYNQRFGGGNMDSARAVTSAAGGRWSASANWA